MKTYEAVYMPADNICWDNVAKEELLCQPWHTVAHIRTWFQLCWNEQGLHIRMQSIEKNILCRFDGLLDSVCRDSCMEFFFSPQPDGRYINIEINPNGALYAGICFNRNQYTRLVRTDMQNVLQLHTFTAEDGWGIEYTVPLSFLSLFYPDLTLYAGKQMRANFYKCGDDTITPHYITWSPVGTPDPDYHQPAYFGKLILK